MSEFQLAGGRPLPTKGLLFVTTSETLSDLGDSGGTVLSKMLGRHKLLVLPGSTDINKVVAALRPDLLRYWGTGTGYEHDGGVVLIGGHKHLPSERKDSISAPIPIDEDLVEATEAAEAEAESYSTDKDDDGGDLDGFIVWTDDRYGDVDTDGVAELPVSRIPCSPTTTLNDVQRMLAASGSPTQRGLRGFRDGTFSQSEAIYAQMRGWSLAPAADDKMVADPPTALDVPELVADGLYLIMHGSGNDRTKYFVYDPGARRVVTAEKLKEAFNLDSTARTGSVVFAACCYSCLSVSKPASSDRPATTLDPDRSVALSFLRLGEIAVVGFTATHWISEGDDLPLYGWDLHQRFWQNYLNEGHPPSRALFNARQEYIANAPRRVFVRSVEDDFWSAVVMKTFWSATCIGLGW